MKVYNLIIELMLNYEIVPGQRLVFVDLAKQLNVSRTPVNNALSILAREGYLDFVPNQGYSVRKLSPKEAEDLYDFREVLEIGFIQDVVAKISESKVEKVEKQKQKYINAVSNSVRRDLFILDMEFHLSILEMAENDILLSRYREICQKIFLRFRTEELKLRRIEENIDEHERLFEAISFKDAEAAKDIIRLHHRNSRESLFPIIFKIRSS